MKKSVWQLVKSSPTTLRISAMTRWPPLSGSRGPSTNMCHSSRPASSSANTRQQLGTKRKRDNGDSVASSPMRGPGSRRKQDLSLPIQVPPHKRLRASQVKPITLGGYKQAVAELETWAERKRKSLEPCKADRTIVEFVHELCEHSRSTTDARSTVFGFILFRCEFQQPEKFLLLQSKAALKGWTATFPTRSRTAVDLQIWDVIAAKCLDNGAKMSAGAIILQGDLYLRPYGVLGLRKKAVIKPISSRSKFGELF